MVSQRKDNVPKKPRRPAAPTLEGRENQLIDLAVGLAEKQLLSGNASSQVISHYLKLGSTREKLEQKKLANENELILAKKEAMAAAGRVEELMVEAINAFRSYSATPTPDSDQQYED